MIEFNIDTHGCEEFINLDNRLAECAVAQGWQSGLILVHVPHTTAAVTINENGDPDVPRDLIMRLAQLAHDPAYRHAEGNSAAHLKCSMIGCQILVPLANGRLRLGTWQSVWFCEFDGPRRRKVMVYKVGGVEHV